MTAAVCVYIGSPWNRRLRWPARTATARGLELQVVAQLPREICDW